MNKYLGLNNHTIPVAGFADPFITSAFIDDDKIFANLFQSATLTHYMFVYSISMNQIITKVVPHEMLECTTSNFPYKTFYNNDDHEIYSCYR